MAYYNIVGPDSIPGVAPKTLHIRVISGQNFPKPRGGGKWLAISPLLFWLGQNILYEGEVQQLRWPSGKNVHPWSCRLWFDSESGQTNDFKISIHSFPA